MIFAMPDNESLRDRQGGQAAVRVFKGGEDVMLVFQLRRKICMTYL